MLPVLKLPYYNVAGLNVFRVLNFFLPSWASEPALETQTCWEHKPEKLSTRLVTIAMPPSGRKKEPVQGIKIEGCKASSVRKQLPRCVRHPERKQPK